MQDQDSIKDVVNAIIARRIATAQENLRVYANEYGFSGHPQFWRELKRQKGSIDALRALQVR